MRSPRLPEQPPPGPTRPSFWRSPLRGPWLASILGSALLPLIVVSAVTGFLSQASYNPGLGHNSVLPGGGLGWDVFTFSWPTDPPWLYAFTQGLHVICGIAAIPLLLAKLWSVMPKLFEWPPLRSLAHLLERASLALLVGGSLFVFFTGLLNVQLYYPWSFNFVPSHYYAAIVFLAALALHVGLKLPSVRRAFRDRGILRPLRADLEHTAPEPYEEGTTAPLEPRAPTMSRRTMLGTVGVASLGVGLMAVGQVVGGPLRGLAWLTPRGRVGDGPNGFPVNKTAAARGILPAETGTAWRLALDGGSQLRLSREDLLAMPQHTYDLPIACVEGWSTTQSWTGVRLRDLAARAGLADPDRVLVESLQKSGAFRRVTLSSKQIADDRSLLALRVNGVDLSPDHGFPARIVVPAAPGVHCTKWVGSMSFERA
ncbi:MAG: molybdopterin-dependent oxidoreductase [Solirubrobacterales bacterium]